MKIANVAILKNQLSRYLQLVRKGEKVRIYDRTKPVADLIPIGKDPGISAKDKTKILVDRLEVEGIIRRGGGKMPSEILTHVPGEKQYPRGLGIVETLLKERREGR